MVAPVLRTAGPPVTPSTTRPLSPRQSQIVNLAAAGHTDKEIALIVGVSIGTLRTYWDRLRHRYEARSRSEVIAKALRNPPIEEMAAFKRHKLPLFVWTDTPVGVVDYRNEWFETRGALAPHEAPGVAVLALMDPCDAQCLKERWHEARTRGEACELLASLRCAVDAELTSFAPRLHKLRAIPLKNEDGIIVRWLGYAREVAEDADERMANFLLSILRAPSVPAASLSATLR